MLDGVAEQKYERKQHEANADFVQPKFTAEKVVRLARGRGVDVVLGPTATELGQRLGREAVQAVGVTDPRFANGIGGVSTSREARRK